VDERLLVLVVDDDPAIRQLIQSALELMLGAATVGAGDGREALRRIADARPSLVVLDVMMPHLSGLEVLRLLKSDSRLREVPVVVLSAVGASLKEARAIGCAAALPKPFDLEMLVDEIERHLGKRRHDIVVGI
jgi:CheY-like chemotaxis protein